MLGRKAKWQVFQDTNGQWRFNLRAKNGEIVLQSEAYMTKQAAIKTIKRISKIADASVIEELD